MLTCEVENIACIYIKQTEAQKVLAKCSRHSQQCPEQRSKQRLINTQGKANFPYSHLFPLLSFTYEEC